MHWQENKIQQFWFCCRMLSVNCQAGPYLYRSTAQTAKLLLDSKTKIIVFYSLNNMLNTGEFGIIIII